MGILAINGGGGEEDRGRAYIFAAKLVRGVQEE